MLVPGNLSDIPAMIAAGACGFKCFLIESGVDEFPCVTSDELKAAMKVVKSCNPDVPVLIHAEQCAHHEHEQHHHHQQNEPCTAANPALYKTYLDSRPTTFETDAISTAISLSRETGARTHVVHLSAAEAMPLFSAAQSEGVPISVETCPHYLTLDANTIPDGATQYKCAPPIRDGANKKQLWSGLSEGTISMIVTDHSPSEPKLKLFDTGDFTKSWGGISSLQLALPLIFSELVNQVGGVENMSGHLEEICSSMSYWMSYTPSRLTNFQGRKGKLAVGHEADFVVFDPESQITIAPEILKFKHKVTPYMGRTLNGKILTTVLAGKIIYHNANPDLQVPPYQGSIVYPNTRADPTLEIVTSEAPALTAEEYKSFGSVVSPHSTGSIVPGTANIGYASRYNWLGEFQNLRPSATARTNVCIFRCQPMTVYREGVENYFDIRLLERHLYSTQMFIPQSNGGRSFRYLVVVCQNGSDDQPDLSTLQCFMADSSQSISYLPGIWHHPLIAVDQPEDFLCFVNEDGSEDDCQVVKLNKVFRVPITAPTTEQ